MPSATIVDWSNSEYHADRTAVSHTSLDCFIADPALYFGRYVTGEFPFETSDAMDFGTLFHRMMLEMNFSPDGDIAVIPDEALTSNGQKRGKAWEQFEAANVGRICLKAEELATLLRMRDSVLKNKTARWLMERKPCFIEQSILFHNEEYDIPLKSRLDVRLPEDGMLVDLKTAGSSNPEAFALAAYRYGYHRQADLYAEAVKALTGEDDLSFVFVVVEKKPPFACRVIELDEKFLDRGHVNNHVALAGMRRCLDTGVWDVPGAEDIITIGEPRWARYEEDYSVAD